MECEAVDMADKKTQMALSMIHSLGPVHWERLAKSLGGEENLLGASHQKLIDAGATKRIADGLSSFSDWEGVKKNFDALDRIGGRMLHIDNEEYPTQLKTLRDAPRVLFVLGEIKPEDQLSVGVVGTRRAGDYGNRISRKLSQQIAGLGVTIISGLALGVDGAAHTGALDANGRTLAVLGSGIDNIYPKGHKALAGQIAKQGAVISEFPPTRPPHAFNFPRRNRIIVGLSVAVLVIAMPQKSGAQITARYAVEQNKDVFVVPGPIDDPAFAGSIKWLKDGAKPVYDAMDVLENVLPDAARRMDIQTSFLNAIGKSKAPPDLPADQALVFKEIGAQPIHIDEISNAVDLTTGQVSTILLELEIKNLVVQLPGKLFRIQMEA